MNKPNRDRPATNRARKEGPGRPLVHGEHQRKRVVFLDDERAAWVSETYGGGHLSTGVRRLIDQAREPK